jgi:hypothetical protein
MQKEIRPLTRELILTSVAVGASDLAVWLLGGHRMAIRVLKMYHFIRLYDALFFVSLLLIILALRRRTSVRTSAVASGLLGGLGGYAASLISLIATQLVLFPEEFSSRRIGGMTGGVELIFLYLAGTFALFGWCSGPLAALTAFLLDRISLRRGARDA